MRSVAAAPRFFRNARSPASTSATEHTLGPRTDVSESRPLPKERGTVVVVHVEVQSLPVERNISSVHTSPHCIESAIVQLICLKVQSTTTHAT